MSHPPRPRKPAFILVAAALAVAALQPPTALRAQESRAWLPAEVYFRAPLAAPREPQFHAAVLSSDLLGPARWRNGGRGTDGVGATEPRELQGSAAIGGTLRMWRMAKGPEGGVVLGLQTGVFGRFRLESTANELVATDWLFALPVEGRWRSLTARIRILHWSAHLGDEIIEATGIERQDFTFEAVDLVAGYDLGSVRLYGGGALVLRSQLEDAADAPEGFTDSGTLQFGADWGWRPWAGGSVGLVAGADVQWADRAAWRSQVSALVGFEARSSARAVTLGARFFDGPSPLGQFYLTDESFWGVELRIDL